MQCAFVCEAVFGSTVGDGVEQAAHGALAVFSHERVCGLIAEWSLGVGDAPAGPVVLDCADGVAPGGALRAAVGLATDGQQEVGGRVLDRGGGPGLDESRQLPAGSCVLVAQRPQLLVVGEQGELASDVVELAVQALLVASVALELRVEPCGLIPCGAADPSEPSEVGTSFPQPGS